MITGYYEQLEQTARLEQELVKRAGTTASGGELGGHSDRDQLCFMDSWPLSSTDQVGHMPKTGISQGTKNRKEKESR